MKYMIAAALAINLAACATSEGYRQHMQELVGQSSDTLLLEFGSPDRVDAMSNGGEIWSYYREQQRSIGGGYYTVPRERQVVEVDEDGNRRTRTIRDEETVYEPPQTWWENCETRFVIDENRIVSNFRFVGDACRAVELY